MTTSIPHSRLAAVRVTVPNAGSRDPSLDQLRTTVLTPTILMGSVPSPLYFSGLTPQFPGVYQVNVGVPQVTPKSNAVPLQVQINGITSPVSASIAVVGL